MWVENSPYTQWETISSNSETDLNQKEYMLFKERRNPLSSLIWKVRTVNKQYNKLEGDFKEREMSI